MTMVEMDNCVERYHAGYDKGFADAKLKYWSEGKWIEIHEENETYYKCSACGLEFSASSGNPTTNMWHFCPNCGAEMKELTARIERKR